MRRLGLRFFPGRVRGALGRDLAGADPGQEERRTEEQEEREAPLPQPGEEEASLSRVKLPVPFVLELAALCSVAVPVLAGLHRSSCALRWLLFSLGVLLILPAVAVLLLRALLGRAWLLARFATGQYVLVGARRAPLPCAWRPSRWLCWHESEDALADAGARRPAQRALHSFGFWMTRPTEEATSQSLAEVTAEPAAAPAAGAGSSASGAADPGAASVERPGPRLVLTCRALRLEAAPALLQGSGRLAGLPWECRFDGSCLLAWPQGASRPPQLLAKAGAWRWDWASKVLASLAALGTCAAALAVAQPLSLDLRCPRRPPLRAFFLLEGSGSRGLADWEREKDAAVGIMSAFQSIYSGGSGGGDLHVGVAEFSDSVRHVVHMTSDVARATALVRGMGLSGGGAALSKALRTCREELSKYTAARGQTFDLCVMISDGVAMDVRSRAGATAHLGNATELFGIHVGSDRDGLYGLHSISSPGFFLSIPSYQELFSVRSAVAANVARASDDRFGALRRPLPRWLPLCLLGALPFLAWWAYLRIPRPRTSRPGLEMGRVRPGGLQPLRRGRSFVEESWSSRDFWFVPAAVFLGLPDDRPMPCHQTLRDRGVLVRRSLAWEDIASGRVAENTAAVSHRWKEHRHPDPDMGKLRKLKIVLRSSANIEFLWIDWMCAPQKFRDDGSLGGRTAEESQEFDDILKSILPCLFLGAQVIILWDRQYNSRFWPNVESWTAMQMPTPRGLVPAPAKRLRARFFGIASVDGQDKYVKQLMMASWHNKTANEAVGVLAADDILVTNAKDKAIGLNVVASLDGDIIRRAIRGQVPAGFSQTIPKRLRGTLDCG